jgi:hypothetical protein
MAVVTTLRDKHSLMCVYNNCGNADGMPPVGGNTRSEHLGPSTKGLVLRFHWSWKAVSPALKYRPRFVLHVAVRDYFL